MDDNPIFRYFLPEPHIFVNLRGQLSPFFYSLKIRFACLSELKVSTLRGIKNGLKFLVTPYGLVYSPKRLRIEELDSVQPLSTTQSLCMNTFKSTEKHRQFLDILDAAHNSNTERKSSTETHLQSKTHSNRFFLVNGREGRERRFTQKGCD